MKKHVTVIICSFSLLLLSACAITSVPVEVEPVSNIIESNREKDELFINANIWLVESFNSAKDVVQFSDKEAGVVMGKYLLRPPSYSSKSPDPNPEGVYALIKIQTKEGATRITIIPESFQEYDSSIRPEASYTREMAQSQINSLIQSYTSFVKYDQSNDW